MQGARDTVEGHPLKYRYIYLLPTVNQVRNIRIKTSSKFHSK